MKALLIYPNASRYLGAPIGISSLAGVITRLGHECFLFDATFIEDDALSNEFVEFASRYSCDVLLIHCTSADWWLVKILLSKLHASLPTYRPFTVIGGQHPTIVPNDVISYPLIDALVIGEGELVVEELFQHLERGSDITGVRNCWVKSNDEVFRNDLRPLIEDLDSLPYPQLNLFEERHRIRFTEKPKTENLKLVNIETSRGCPYSCTFCMNSYARKLYKGLGKYYRIKSADRIIDEAKIAKEEFDVNFIQIIDDNFLHSSDRLEELAWRFPKEVGLPVSLQASADKITERTIDLLKAMGTEILAIGIETGNEKYRRQILRKEVSDEQIIKAIRLAKDRGIGTMAYYMIGLPFEKKEYVRQTIEFNKIARPDICVVSTFYPFPGTPLYEAVLDKGLINNMEFSLDFYHESSMKFDDLSPDDFVSLREEFRNAAKFLGPLSPRDRLRIV